MLKRLVVGVSALVLAGGAFMTAQALTTDGQQLPTINAPLTVPPATGQTSGQPTTAPTSPTSPVTTSSGSGDCGDRHGDSGRSDDCGSMQTVVPPPSVFTDDHGRHGETEPGDDHGGRGEAERGDDHGGHGEAEPGDDHGGHGEAEPGDDRGGHGEAEPGDDHGRDG